MMIDAKPFYTSLIFTQLLLELDTIKESESILGALGYPSPGHLTNPPQQTPPGDGTHH